jgi:hypothetical protein
MIEAECLAAIADGEDAQCLLLAAMPSAKRRFKAVDRALIRLLADVRVHFPDATYYTASGGFNLLLGRSHDESANARAQDQLVALSGNASISDGDF